jgi:hypothetical protein
MKTSNHPQPGAAELLLSADLIQGYARRLENLATWRDTLLRNSDAKAAGDNLGMAALLRDIQASRFAGIDTDVGFFVVCQMAERHAETIFETDRQLNELSSKIRAIEQREGLDELDEFDPDHPETPADWKALNGKSNRRFQAVEKIRDARFIRWLRRHGELDITDLFANDRAAFDRRREVGRCKIYGPMPDIITAASQGDTGVTEVISQNE